MSIELPSESGEARTPLVSAEVHGRAAALVRAAARGNTRGSTVRIDVLGELLDSGQALNAAQIHKRLLGPPNLVTIYRTLDWLESVGLAGSTSDMRGVRCYYAKQSRAPSIVFYCDHCGRALPLPHAVADDPDGVPLGFTVRELRVSLLGMCSRCDEVLRAGRAA